MKVLASDKNLVQLEMNGAVLDRKDGTFHVSDQLGKSMVKSGEFAATGTTFRHVTGYVCPNCGRENVIKDSCGGCGWHETD